MKTYPDADEAICVPQIIDVGHHQRVAVLPGKHRRKRSDNRPAKAQCLSRY